MMMSSMMVMSLILLMFVDGNVVVYFGNNIANEGDEITFKATVKEHGEYKDVKQTIVQRVKVL